MKYQPERQLMPTGQVYVHGIGIYNQPHVDSVMEIPDAKTLTQQQLIQQVGEKYMYALVEGREATPREIEKYCQAKI